MAQWTLQPAGSAEPIHVRLEAAGERFTLHGDGDIALSGQWSLTPEGEGVLRVGARVHRFYAARVGNRLQVWLDGETYVFSLPQAERIRGRPGAADAASGEVTAPMPGQVLKVLVEAGDQVVERAPLAVIESMKMELTVSAPAAGRVAEVRCEPGRMVDMGDVLMRLEAGEG